MFQTKFEERFETHILCSVTVSENYAVYEVMWKNFLEPGRPQITMHIACWIPKVTNTRTEFVILIVVTL